MYLVIGRDCASPTLDAYASITDPPYTGQMFQPADPPGAADCTDSFEEEPPLLEGNLYRCLNIIYSVYGRAIF